MHTISKCHRDVFVIATGQEDNIGDIILRRNLLGVVSQFGTLHIFCGDHSDAFIYGLRQGSAIIYSDWSLWNEAMLGSFRSGPVLLFEKPGELQNTLKVLRNHAKSRLRRYILRRNGGRAYLLGVGFRHTLPWWKQFAFRILFQDFEIIGWRDVRSHDELQIGEIVPDWAFLEAQYESNAERDKLLIALRGDRAMPNETWFRGVAKYALKSNLEICVVTQVGRDYERSKAIAQKFGVKCNPWHNGDYYRQEQDLRNLYRKAKIVISDRMHVLILASIEGSVPICLADQKEEKIERHFKAIDFEGVSLNASDSSPEEIANLIEVQTRRAEELHSKMRIAQKRLVSIVDRIRENLCA